MVDAPVPKTEVQHMILFPLEGTFLEGTWPLGCRDESIVGNYFSNIQ